MTYKEFIQNILDTRGRFACGEEYHERHHIVPKCMDGSNEEENLIDLFAREHFEAHKLLALENPDNEKLVYAWHMMSIMNDKNNRDYEITPDEYEEARTAFSSALSSNMSGSNNIMYGKRHTEETKKKIGENARERYVVAENHPMYGKHHTEETKNKISQSKNGKYGGENNPMFGRHHSEDTKNKMSKAKKGVSIGPLSEEHKKKISESKKNKNGKCVIQLTLNDDFVAEYITAHEAERITGIDHSTILGCCNHKPHYNTAGGFKWISKEEYDENYNYIKRSKNI